MSLLRIAAIDDQPQNVEVLMTAIQDYLDAEAVPFDRLPATPESVSAWVRDVKIDAVLIDHDLRKGNYSTSDGMNIAAELFRQDCPTVLTTMYSMADLKDGIWHRRYLPAFLLKGRLEMVDQKMEIARAELRGHFAAERKAYRTVVRVDDVVGRHSSLVVAAYNPSEGISVSTDELTKRLGKVPVAGMRFMAEVNIGAPSGDELFISEVEA